VTSVQYTGIDNLTLNLTQTTTVAPGQLILVGTGNLTATAPNTAVSRIGTTAFAPAVEVSSSNGAANLTLGSSSVSEDNTYAVGVFGATSSTANVGSATSNSSMVLEVVPGGTATPTVTPAAAITASSGSGTVSVTNTTALATGAGGHGITATGHDVVVNSGTVTTTGAAFTDTSTGVNYVPYGIAGVSAGGNVQISSGTINTAGVVGDGIFARAVTSPGNTINITSSSIKLTGDGAVGINAMAMGNVTVNAGSIETDGQFINYSNVFGGDVGQTTHTAEDIRAISTGGAVNVTVATAKALGGTSGAIYASATGDVTMTLGDVTADSGVGTLTSAGVYGESLVGNQHVTFNGVTQGQTEAVALMEDANKMVTVDVNPLGGTGSITATGTALHVLDNSATAAASGSVVINNSGSISGGTTGILVDMRAGTGSGAIINNHGIISGGTNAIQMIGSTNDTLNIFTGSSITGTVDLGSGTDTVNLIGTSNTKTNTQAFGGNLVNTEALDVQSGYWTQAGAMPASTVTIDGSATLETVAIDSHSGLFTKPAGTFVQQIVDNGTLVLTNSDTNVYAGSTFMGLSGSGAVNIVGGGTVLYGDTPLTGLTTVTNGTLVITGHAAGSIDVEANGLLRIGATQGPPPPSTPTVTPIFSGGAVGDVAGNIIDNGMVQFERGNAHTYAGALSGTGGVSVMGNGALTLTGADTYTGATSVQSGGLTVTGAFASSAVSVASGTLFNYANATDQTFGGNITGAGAFTKTNVGNLTFSGVANNTGGFTVNGNLTDVGAINSGVGIGGGTLTIGNGGTTGSVSGDIGISGTLVLNRSDDFTLAGVLSGGGSLTKMGAGNVTLTGVSTFAGQTSILQGGLTVTNGFGAGSVAISGGANFTVNNTSDLSLAAFINGAGALNKAGAGTLTYSGSDNGAGVVNVTAGNLLLTGTIFGDVNVAAGAGMAVGNGSAGGVVFGNITDNGGVTFNKSGNTTYAGIISGSGSLTQASAGTLTLGGVNTYTGLTTVSNGGLIVTGSLAGGVSITSGTGLLIGAGQTTGSVAGDIVDNGAATFNRTDAISYGGVISGSGQVNISTGIVTLTGANTYSGSTNVASGARLIIGAAGTSGAVAGDIVNNGGLSFNRSDVVSYGGVISGTGSLTQAGSGSLTLAAPSTVTGGTTVAAGTLILPAVLTSNVTVNAGATLQIGAGGTTGGLVGNLVDNGTAIFNRSDSFSFDGAFSGNGSLVKQGAGVLTLDGAYTFSGTTTVQGGSVNITQLNSTGTLVVGGGAGVTLASGGQTIGGLSGSAGSTLNLGSSTLTVDNTGGSSVFSGAVTGTGSLAFTGAGTTDLAGTNTYTGATQVSGGTLKVNGSITSNTTVGSGGTLGGSGVINGSLTVNSGGTLSPGNSPGIITVNGPLTLASGSTTIIEVDPTAAQTHDQINVTGTATITTGAKLAVRPLGAIGAYAANQLYPILTATGGLTGTFANSDVTSSMAFLTPFLHYSANELDLQLVRNDITFAGVASTANQTAVATAAEATGPAAAPFNALIGQDAAGARSGFNALSGETYGAIGSFLIGQSRYARDAFLDRATGDDGRGAWAQVFDASTRADGTSNTASASDTETGIAGGADATAGAWTFGLSASYVNSDVSQSARAASASVKTYGGGLYVGTKFGGFHVGLGADFEQNEVDAKRAIVFPTISQNVSGSYNGHTNQFFGQVSYPTQVDGFDVTPFADVADVQLKTDAFSETGGTLGLSVSGQSRSVVLTDLGARWSGHFDGGGFTLYPELSVAWRHASGDIAGLSKAGFGTSTFTVQGDDLAANAAAIKAGFSADLGKSGKVWLDYDGVIGNANTSNGVKLGASFKF
jgi:fibronectin-binding autotransporter adhesin